MGFLEFVILHEISVFDVCELSTNWVMSTWALRFRVFGSCISGLI